jgi:hypothetical protein
MRWRRSEDVYPLPKAMRTVGLVATPTGMALRELFETDLKRQAK